MKARLAPTPSGFLHRGNIANFLLNARLADGGGLLLRIDDLDRARFRPEYLEDIFRVVDRLGLPVTDGPSGPDDFARHWSQRHRLGHYEAALEQLRGHKRVFACPCSRKELSTGRHRYNCPAAGIDPDRPDVAWRVSTQPASPVGIPDLTGKIFPLLITHSEIPDFVIRKKDGSPSYQLTCTVDDHLFAVSRVGRGVDLLPSTAAQAILADLLGYEPLFTRVRFVHHQLIAGGDGEKLSKSAGAEGAPLKLDDRLLTHLTAVADGWLRPLA